VVVVVAVAAVMGYQWSSQVDGQRENQRCRERGRERKVRFVMVKGERYFFMMERKIKWPELRAILKENRSRERKK